MDCDPVDGVQAALERRIAGVLAGTAEFKAPRSIEAQVLSGIERRAIAPWWRRSVPEWPRLAQAGFAVTGIAAAVLLLLGRPSAPARLDAVISQPVAMLRRPATDLHAAMQVLSVFHRLTETVADSLPVDVWYGGMALCAVAYVVLFFLVVFGYRSLQAPITSSR